MYAHGKCITEVYIHRHMGSVRQDYICIHVSGVYDIGTWECMTEVLDKL